MTAGLVSQRSPVRPHMAALLPWEDAGPAAAAGDCQAQQKGQALEKEGPGGCWSRGGFICGHFLQHPKSWGCR